MERRWTRWARRLSGVLLPASGVIATVLLPEQLSFTTKIAVVGSVVILAGLVYTLDSERRIRRLSDEKARIMLEKFVFLRVRQEASGTLPDTVDSDIRVNVMLYRRRDTIPTGERKLAPWRRSLQIQFWSGDYDERDETQLKWLPGEGLCGNALSDEQVFARTLNVKDRQEWNMTKSQFGLTDHIGSLVSIPIYAHEDEEKHTPVGVLNLDTRDEVDESKLKDLAEEIKPYARYVGMVV